ncbi:zinc-ribbon domain-containing protein [Candidatus Oscillochloris fontis]|uniref:zinc-ribbon domain-containing protein n=1 Tax=Candidatus Oscillochloris fontis TaxID=2496868 RepID=UPI00137617E4|nr:zinc-ribbon domain-containing protein [Candidatus Oscillochloris fontis]
MSDVRYCPACGAQVSANERFCGVCGSRMEVPPAAPTVPVGGGPTQVLPPEPAGTAFGVPPSSTVLPAKRGLPVWAIVLAVVGGLVVVGCMAIFGLVSIFGDQISSTPTTRPTSGSGAGGIVPPPLRPSSEPTDLPTATAANITGGIVGVISADASVVRTAEAATAQAASAAAQVEAEVATLIASAKLIFSDAFVDNRNAWFTGVFEEIETDKIEDGVFKVQWSARGTSYELYEVRKFTNFIVEVDCLVYQGGGDGSCSLVFDQENDVGFYKYEVFDDYYRLFVVGSSGDPIMLSEGDPVGIVKAGDVNRLRVIRQGAQIRIFLNGTLLDTLSDSTYQGGKIGVSTNCYNDAGGVEIWFDNFSIWELP